MGELLTKIPLMTEWGIEYLEVRRNPFGDPNTVELVLPAHCKNRVILPVSLFDPAEIRIDGEHHGSQGTSDGAAAWPQDIS